MVNASGLQGGQRALKTSIAGLGARRQIKDAPRRKRRKGKRRGADLWVAGRGGGTLAVLQQKKTGILVKTEGG